MSEPSSDRSSRRRFLATTGALAAGAALPGLPAGADRGQDEPVDEPRSLNDLKAPAEGGGPAITSATLREAEKLAGIELTEPERAQILEGIESEVARFLRRRSFAAPNDLAPATVFDPRLPGRTYDTGDGRVVRSEGEPGPVPQSDVDLAYAPVMSLSRWIERGDLTSERLTRVCLERLEKHGPALECVVTLLPERAMEKAKRADAEIKAGRYRGPLHGIPWGAKDLFDTAGTKTTWGATPYKDRVAERDAVAVTKLDEAGAVLVAKLTLGALAYGDIWFGGRTNNPWNLEQGSSGSSAGSAAAVAAGLVPFALGTETLGSIVSPCMRCGTTGLRPTFGRVNREGAMALCWSLDKIGPITRRVEDAALVLAAINGGGPGGGGATAGDPAAMDVPFSFDGTRSAEGLRVGFNPSWFEGRWVRDPDRAALDAARAAGAEPVEVDLPDLPYDALMTILTVEAATAFEELTLSNRDDELVWQEPEAWPNTFRTTRFAPAIEFVQADRLRRHVMRVMDDLFRAERLDALISPSYAASLLLITNHTGHPSLTIRTGITDRGTPHGITLWGDLFGEGRLCNLGAAIERRLGVWEERPPRFS